jgi:D-3-phosphoglycerate dehydrogenase / 2-oxoglutarate reductase
MTQPVVVLTDETIHRAAIDLLAPTCELRVLRAYPPEAELAAACADAQGILARLGNVTRRVIEQAPRLVIIARHGVGVDAVDLAAATARGIVVTTTGSENAAAVAEYTFALLLTLLRKVTAADHGMRQGEWSRNALVGVELDGKTLGIIGFGAIGRRVARQGLGFGMRVLAYDPHVTDPGDPAIELVSFARLLSEADVVTVHTRLTPQTACLLDVRAFAAMKSGAYFVNTARGEIVDEPALIRALQSNAIAGAALDAYAEEPLPAASLLRQLDNVLLSPHVAGQTGEALMRVAVCAAESILDEFAGRRPRFVYNPEAYAMRASAAKAGSP